MKKIYFLIIWSFYTLPLFGQSIEGSWSGQLDAGSNKLRLDFDFILHDSVYVGTMDSPDQAAFGIPLSSVDFNLPELSFEIRQLGVIYKGVLQADTLIVGTFTQQGVPFPLSLTRGKPVANRPQEPKPPYPYNSEEV